MKPKIITLLCLGLSCLLLFTACSTQGGDALGSTATGRYVEESIPLPAEISNLLYFGPQPDGSLLMVGFSVNRGLLTFQSLDGGQSWEKFNPAWRSALAGLDVTCLTFDTEGNPYFVYQKPYSAQQEEEEDDESYFSPPKVFCRLRIEEDQLDILPIPQEYDGIQVSSLKILQNGDIAVVYAAYLVVYDGETFAEKQVLQSQSLLIDGVYFEQGGAIALTDNDSLKLYEAASGTLKGEIALQRETARPSEFTWSHEAGSKKQTIVCAGPTGDGYYYANTAGLFHVLADGQLGEKLLDGGLCSLSLPTQDILHLMALEDNTFLALLRDVSNELCLYRYTFDPNAPTLPSTELRVWALEDSPTLRLAMNTFQRVNPDVWVHLEVANTDSGQTVEDALRTLATELLAGQGPDILMLDGVPLESYIRQGTLLNLDGLLDKGLWDELYENIAFPLQQESGVYAVAGRFTVPVAFGSQEALQAAQTLPALAEYLSTQDSPMFGVATNALMRTFYPLFAEQWFSEDGTLQTEAFRRDLQAMGQIAQPFQGKTIPSLEGDLKFCFANWQHGLLPLYLGELRKLEDLGGSYSLREYGWPEILSAYPNPANASVRPRLLLGIAATSTHPQEAAQFITHVLSYDMQTSKLNDGLPVHRAALAQTGVDNANTGWVDEAGRHMYLSLATNIHDPFGDGQSHSSSMQMYWPSEDYLQEMSPLWENANQPILVDRVVQEILVEETLDYLQGSKSLDATLESVAQRLNLYAAETQG